MHCFFRSVSSVTQTGSARSYLVIPIRVVRVIRSPPRVRHQEPILTSRGSKRASGSTRSILRRHHLVDVPRLGTSSSRDSSVTPRARRNRCAISHVNISFALVRLILRPAPCDAELSDAATPFPRTTYPASPSIRG